MKKSGEKLTGHCPLLWSASCVFSIILLISDPMDCIPAAILQAQVVSAPSFSSMQSVNRPGTLPKLNQLGFQSKSSGNPIQNLLKSVGSPNLDESTTSVAPSKPKLHSDVFKQVQGFVSRFIAPAKFYADLINRYHQWFANYESIRKSLDHPILEAMDVFKLEYAKVEQKLLEDEVKKVKISTAVNHKIEESENLDFVFNVIKQLIVNLEEKLKLLEENEGVVAHANVHPEAAIENEEAVKETLARVERSFVNHAKTIIKEESVNIMKKFAFTSLAAFMEAKPDTGDLLDHLRPVISILACASTPIAVSYLQDIQFRASLAIITHSLETIVPISKIAQDLENSTRNFKKA